MSELIYTDDQLDAMSKDRLMGEYCRLKNVAKMFLDTLDLEEAAYQLHFLYRNYANLIKRGEAIEAIRKALEAEGGILSQPVIPFEREFWIPDIVDELKSRLAEIDAEYEKMPTHIGPFEVAEAIRKVLEDK